LLFFSPINLDKPIPKNISLTLLKWKIISNYSFHYQ
jgi:hypothetical protein